MVARRVQAMALAIYGALQGLLLAGSTVLALLAVGDRAQAVADASF